MADLPHETEEPMVSLEHLPSEIQHKIFIGLDVRGLIRCRTVCKSWSSLVSDPLFIKAHLDHHYDKDRDDERFGNRRITMHKESIYHTGQQYDFDYDFFGPSDRHLLGSSNGLVCISSYPSEVIVINPLTREVKQVTIPGIHITDSLCWGFGYDSIKDDYKLVLGVGKGENCTCIQVFSLRTEMWKLIGEVSYVFTSRVGTLCNGVLHWLVYDNTSTEKKNVILSFHFSGEKFVEVPAPDDVRYPQLYIGPHSSLRLGTIDERLCVFRRTLSQEVLVMNKEQSWQMLREVKDDSIVRCINLYVPSIHQEIWSSEYWFCKHRVFFGTPTYVESIVSPNFHKRKRQATSAIESPKVKTNGNAADDMAQSAVQPMQMRKNRPMQLTQRHRPDRVE